MAKEVFQLEVQVNTNPALTGLNALDKKLKDVKDSADKIGKGNPLGGLSSSVKTLTTSFAGLGSVLGGLAIGKIATEAVQSMAAFQSLQVTLGTVTGDITKAADAMKLLKDVAAVTPFSVGELGASFIKLKSSGIEPTAEKLKLFSDVASVTTDKIGALTAISDLYARTTAGGLGLEELNRLAERGIPVYDILSKRIGVNRLEISELGKSAQGSALILRQLEAGLKDAFSGASAKSLNTLDGQFGQLKKNLEQLAVTAGGAGATQGLTDLTRSLNELTVALQPIAAVLGGAIGDSLKVVATGISELTTNTVKFITVAVGLAVVPGVLRSLPGLVRILNTELKYLAIDAAAAFDALTGGIVGKGSAIKIMFVQIAQVVKLAGQALLTFATGGIASGFTSLINLFARFAAALVASPITGFLVRMAALAGILNPIGATIAAIVGTLFIFRNSLVSVGDDSASVAELVFYAFKKMGDAIAWPFVKLGELISEFGKLIAQVPGVTAAADAIGAAWNKAGKLASDAWEWTKDATLGSAIRSISKDRADENSAKARADFRKQESEDAEKIRNATDATAAADRKLAEDLKTGRAATLLKILDSLRQESSLLGKTKQDAERLTKEYELQNSIKAKLLTSDPTLTASQLESRSQLTGEERAKIAGEISKKYQQQSVAFMTQMVAANNLEISLLGKSNNERERANKLEEIRLQLGMSIAEWTKVKAQYEKEIVRSQEAQINDSLQKNLKGIQLETEYLKLGNEEREKRIALDKAAADAGYKDAAELEKRKPKQAAQIRDAVGVKVQTGIDVEAQKTIENLKKERELLEETNDLKRESAKRQDEIYRAIDPEGRGKKISEGHKTAINDLLKSIEMQEKLLEINKKINDGFATLGDAVSDWALGTEGAIKRVRLALLQLALTSIFKNQLAAGGPTGSFIGGILGGLSGARAEGGPVTAGKSYLVGEKRPEVFVPSTNGYIVPNTAMMNTTTGATTVTLSPNLIIQGSVTGQTELENMFDQFSSAMANETQKFVINQLGQNGILAR